MFKLLTQSIGSIFGTEAKSRPVAKVQKTPTNMGTKPSVQGKYHCVEVQPGQQICEASRNIQGQRFLPAEAPTFPLPGCDQQACQCRYVHHDDRRDDSRRNPYRQWAIELPAEGGERRSRSDRRKPE